MRSFILESPLGSWVGTWFSNPTLSVGVFPFVLQESGEFDPGGPQESCSEAFGSTAEFPKTNRDGSSEQTTMRTTAV